MKLTRVLSKINCRPWALEAGGQAAVAQLIASKLTRAEMPDVEEYGNVRTPFEIDGNGIGHICISGVMAKGISKLEAICGGYDYEWLDDDLAQAEDAKVQGLMINFDTPGGSCEGLPECADKIAQMAKRIPVFGWTDQTCASAGYFLASSCSRIYAAPSAMVGSIGVIIGWIDSSAQWANAGLSWQPIVSGDLKGAGMGPSLTPAQRESMQRLVNDSFALFRNNILRSRRVNDSAMQGELYLAGRAAELNLIDGANLTEDQAYAKLAALI